MTLPAAPDGAFIMECPDCHKGTMIDSSKFVLQTMSFIVQCFQCEALIRVTISVGLARYVGRSMWFGHETDDSGGQPSHQRHADRIALEHLHKVLKEMCDYMFDTDDQGDYIIGNWADVNLEGMLPSINGAMEVLQWRR